LSLVVERKGSWRGRNAGESAKRNLRTVGRVNVNIFQRIGRLLK
jgi:hypothetical protein